MTSFMRASSLQKLSSTPGNITAKDNIYRWRLLYCSNPLMSFDSVPSCVPVVCFCCHRNLKLLNSVDCAYYRSTYLVGGALLLIILSCPVHPVPYVVLRTRMHDYILFPFELVFMVFHVFFLFWNETLTLLLCVLECDCGRALKL